MSGPLPSPSATGVRIAGDHFQWVIAWTACVEALRDRATRATNPAVAIGLEVDDAGNLDDAVTYRQQTPHTYRQVKYAVDASSPVNFEYLTARSRTGGPSILRKLHDARCRLVDTDGDCLELRLVTNRAADPQDLLVRGRDPRTGLLLPKAGAGTARSAIGQARASMVNLTREAIQTIQD